MKNISEKEAREIFESFNPSIFNKKDKFGNYEDDTLHNTWIGFKHWYTEQTTHKFIKNWAFEDGEKDEEMLAVYIAKVAEKNGLNIDNVYQIFPLVLRMLKSKSEWAK